MWPIFNKGMIFMKDKNLGLNFDKQTITMFITGCLIIIITTIFFNAFYYSSVAISAIEKWGILAGLAIGSFLGLVMMFVSVTKNLKSVKRLYVICGISVAVLLASSALFETVRAVIFLIVVDFFIYAVASLLKKFVVTILSLSLYAYFGLLLLMFIVRYFVDQYWILYVGLCVIFISYRYVGLPINKFFIKHLWNEQESQEYNKEQLILQLKLYYLAFWIFANITGNIYNSQNMMIYNNIFLTVVLFIDIDFKKMIGWKRNSF